MIKVETKERLDTFVFSNYFADSREKAKALIASDIMQAHVEYAKTIVSMYHNAECAEKAYERYKQVAKGCTPDNIDEISLGKETATIIECLMASKLCSSTSEARRLIQGNGVKVNGQTCSDINFAYDLTKETIIQKGKNKFFKAIV